MRIIILVIALTLSACVSYESNTGYVDTSLIPQIKVGTSTKSEIIALFGIPSSTTIYPQGEMFIYQEMHLKTSAGFGSAESNMPMKVLAVSFDTNGIVSTFNSSESNPVTKGRY